MEKLLKSTAAALIMLALQCLPSYAETGVTDGEILVGMSTALSGPSSFLGTSFRQGVEACMSMTNEQGGVNGRKLRLIVYDDGYEPGRSAPNVTRLIKEDKVFCLLGNVGTPTTMAIKPILTEEKVPLFGPFTGSDALRKPVVRYILHYRASYSQELEEFIKGMADTLGHKKIAVFYQNDSYGKAVLKGARAALAKRGIEPVVASSFERNSEDIALPLQAIIREKPEAVVMAGTYTACAKFIKEGKKKKFTPIYMNVSFVGPDKLAEILGKEGDGVVVTQVVPPYSDAHGYPVVEEYIGMLKKYFPGSRPNSVSLEGFITAKLFVEGLRRAGKNLTRDSFIDAVEGIKELDIKAGGKISFSRENHQGSQKVYPTVIKDGRFHLIKDWNSL